MSIIYFLIGCSTLIALIFLIAFFWANKTGQNDDLYTPSVRILFDDGTIKPTEKQDENENISAKAETQKET